MQVGAENTGKQCVHFVKIKFPFTLGGGALWEVMMGSDDGK